VVLDVRYPYAVLTRPKRLNIQRAHNKGPADIYLSVLGFNVFVLFNLIDRGHVHYLEQSAISNLHLTSAMHKNLGTRYIYA
jgi:hypothetical protein